VDRTVGFTASDVAAVVVSLFVHVDDMERTVGDHGVGSSQIAVRRPNSGIAGG
jgi:hypothetical protein